MVATPVLAEDDPRAKPLFKAGADAGNLLESFQSNNKAVIVVVRGGVSYAGKVKAVSNTAVVLTGLRGKEFFDAWIPFDSIVAMEERTRMR